MGGEQAEAGGATVEAYGLSLEGSRGWVYRDVEFRARPGRLTALVGEAGTGRTALLLTLGGRMRQSSGIALVDGLAMPRQRREIQAVAALGVIEGVNDLEPNLTVAEQLTEALEMSLGVFGSIRRRARRQAIADSLERVGLDASPSTHVYDLLPDESQLLGAALALVGDPGLLLLDDVDAGLSEERRYELWQRLNAIAGQGVTVLATCHEAARDQPQADVVRLPLARGELAR